MAPPTGYYDSARGRSGVGLLRALHDVTERTHEPRSWKEAQQALFRTVADPDGDNTIVDLYSGKRLDGVASPKSAAKHDLTVEHVWPQSEGATEAARSDLHHLRPALASLNTHRSNLPYGEVRNPDWASPAVAGVSELSMVGTDARGVKVFMPRASMRGDVARDQLYFFTRYHGDRPAEYSLDNFRVSLPTLLRWHHEDPVSYEERLRNQAIFELQGNRNPYVDHPGYVDRVGFSPSLLSRPAADLRDADR